MTEPDDLRRSLDDVAATIDVGDLDLATVSARARRRRRRFQLAAGLGAAALVAGATVAVVAFTTNDEPDRLVTTDAEETDTSSPPTTAGDEEPLTTELSTAPAQTVRVIDRTGVVGQVAGVDGAPQHGEWTAAWKDGFLVGSLAFAPQPLPTELPEEVSALFPQEVRDLFGGELPPTIAEATEMLREAGLLETVTEIIQANPEAYEAIYSVRTDEPPTLDVRYTTDGLTWEPIEMTLPPDVGYISGATTVGERLVVWYGSQGPLGDPGDGKVRVATTVDLVNWNVQEIVTTPPSVELPAGVTWSAQPNGLVANESGWMASVYAGIDVDPFELIPAEDRAALDQSGGYSFSTDDTGFTIDPDGDDADLTYTWAELGVAPEIAEFFGDGNYQPTTWAAAWDGVPAPSLAPGPVDGVLATPAGFVALGGEVGFSPDGVTWSSSPLPVEDAYYVTSSFTFDGGIIALVDTPDGVQIHRLDERGGSPQRLDIPGLPATASGLFGPGGRLGVVLDATDHGPPPPPVVVEVDGHRLTIDHASGITDVVDLASGEVVATLDMRGADEDGPITWDDDGVTVTDPTTGEVVVVFPADDIEAASEEAFAREATVDGPYHPDLWLLATADGETFVVEDLDDTDAESFLGPNVLTANGSRLLLQVGGTWVVYDLR
jgi:hypothetical protein